ncbi:hypothetical protein LIA77_00330 [Sarocladium implicatum]|nr:hypothetical protein LIA77_00330 [Sarocladium implicatum]
MRSPRLALRLCTCEMLLPSLRTYRGQGKFQVVESQLPRIWGWSKSSVHLLSSTRGFVFSQRLLVSLTEASSLVPMTTQPSTTCHSHKTSDLDNIVSSVLSGISRQMDHRLRRKPR